MTLPRPFRGSDRAVSTALGYALSLMTTSLLISGLLITGGGVVDDQREQTIRDELNVIGQQIAADLTAADRLAETAPNGDVHITRRLPAAVARSSYVVELDYTPADDSTTITLRSNNPEVVVTVAVVTETPVVDGQSFAGGEVRFSYNAGTSYELKVTNV